MRNPIKVVGRLVFKLLGLYSLYNLRRWGFLREKGWFRSFRELRPVDAEGRPVPWFAYAMTQLLEQRVTRDMSVLEYGAGYSTLWWAARVKRVVACEHDSTWYGRIRAMAPGNVELVHLDHGAEGPYSRYAADCGAEFDIIVVDGADRTLCAKRSVGALKPGGVMVWDDTNLPEYAAGIAFLVEKGFRRLDIVGMRPSSSLGHTTSVFYRADNVLGI